MKVVTMRRFLALLAVVGALMACGGGYSVPPLPSEATQTALPSGYCLVPKLTPSGEWTQVPWPCDATPPPSFACPSWAALCP